MRILKRTLNRYLGTKQSASRSRTRAKLVDQIKTHPRVLALDGKAEGFAEWFVSLAPGWRWAGDPMDYTHCFGASTLTEAMQEIRKAEACDCDQCRRELTE